MFFIYFCVCVNSDCHLVLLSFGLKGFLPHFLKYKSAGDWFFVNIWKKSFISPVFWKDIFTGQRFSIGGFCFSFTVLKILPHCISSLHFSNHTHKKIWCCLDFHSFVFYFDCFQYFSFSFFLTGFKQFGLWQALM